MRVLGLIVCVWLTAPTAPGDDKPLPLVGLESARRELHTGHVVWSTRCNLPRKDDGVIYRWHSYDVPRYYTSRFTTGEYMVEDNGDPHGVVFPTRDGTPHPDIGYRPMRYLWHDDAQWEHRDGSVGAYAFVGRRDLVDVRTFGVSAGLGLGTTLDDLFRHAGPGTAYETRVSAGLYEISVGRRGSSSAVRYLLDPESGWNPVRVTVVSDGRVLRQARVTLKRYADVWFPERVELYEHTHEDGQEPLYVIDVLSASFNQPDHPRQLMPESIGIEVGTNIHVYPKGNVFRPTGVFGWDGEKLVPQKELFKRIRSGELETGPRVKAAVERSLSLGRRMDRFEAEWERYVRHFIEKYRLSNEQAETAMRILRDCSQKAKQYVAKHKDEIEKIRESVRELSDPSKSKAVNRSERMHALKERMLRLRAPITDIFCGNLVPRLEKLPTRAQRQAAANPGQAEKKPDEGTHTEP